MAPPPASAGTDAKCSNSPANSRSSAASMISLRAASWYATAVSRSLSHDELDRSPHRTLADEPALSSHRGPPFGCRPAAAAT